MDIADNMLCVFGGFILLIAIHKIISWEFTVVVMFFWICYKIEIVVFNQKIITTNQYNLEKNIKEGD